MFFLPNAPAQTAPVVITQPSSQTALAGSNVTLWVTVADGSSPSLPSVATGTLRLWLKADAGVITNSSGQISQWQDQSGNTNHASQANSSSQPVLVYPAGLGAKAAVRFNGVLNAVNGNFLSGTGNVGVPNALTSFTVYNAFSNVISGFDWGADVWSIGSFNGQDSCRAFAVWQKDMDFSFGSGSGGYGADNADSDFMIPTNTYRICTDRLNTNLNTIEMFDTSASSETNLNFAVTALGTPPAGYSVGGMDPSLQQYANGRCFDGDIAELLIYNGYLSDSDRLAVQNYLQQKYSISDVNSDISYQWQYDGTNIAGATNATLTLTNLQINEAGSYSVIVTNLEGSATSSNAVLTPVMAPVITLSPSNQTVAVGTSVTFSGAATGTAPVTYQWQFDGANISGATNTSLTLTNAVLASAGSYSMVATNPYGSATSAVAVLTVDESTVQLVSTSAAGGGTFVVSIDLNALGTEAAFGLSLDFNPALLTFQGVSLGSGAVGGALEANTNQVASGLLGLGVDLFSGTFAAGTNDIFDVTFQAAVVTNATIATLTFGNVPTSEEVANAQAQVLPAIYVPGTVAISPTSLEGDVSPRPNGNELLSIADWVQEGRFVAGLDTPANGSEFQRADCAPRATLGDGQITVADWVQVGRYAVGLDPLTAAGGPSSPGTNMETRGRPVKLDSPRPVMLVPLTQGGLSNSAAVEMVAQGDETAVGFSISFNPAVLRFINASLGSGAHGGALIQNTAPAASGQLGFVVGFAPPGTFVAGTQQLLQLNFSSVLYSNNAALAFGDAPVVSQIADSLANPLLANFQNGTLAVGGSAWPSLSISPATGNNIVLAWPLSAATMGLQVAPAPEGPWSDAATTTVTNGNNLILTYPVSTNTEFFRLKY